MWFRATLNFRNFKVASTAGACTEFFYTLPKVASYPAYQNSMIRKHFTAGRKIAPNTGTNTTKFFTLATKS